MKKIIALTVLFLISVTIHSQVLISILFGDKLNTDKLTFGLALSNAWNSLSGYSKVDAQSNFNLGIFLTLKLKQRLFIQFDALAKYKSGAKGLPVYSLNDPLLDSMYQYGSLQRSINCLALITTLQYRFWKSLNVELGPHVSLRLKTIDVFSADHEEGKLQFEKEVSDATTRFDFGATGGISWQFNKGTGVKAGVRYYTGLVDMFPSDEGQNATRSFQINVYIPIGREKESKQR
jgi:hypothetical protein